MAESNLGRIVIVDENDQIINKITHGNGIQLDYDSNNKILEINSLSQPKAYKITLDIGTTGWTQESLTGKYTKLVDVSDLNVNDLVQIAPTPASLETWAECGVYCGSQATNKLGFYADTLPLDGSQLIANVVIWRA